MQRASVARPDHARRGTIAASRLTPRVETKASAISNFAMIAAQTFRPKTSEFTSDTGRKPFGFSHEELDGESYYEGEFRCSLRHGQGTLHSPTTGQRYEGAFHCDRCHGMGTLTTEDGTYKGLWRHGQKHGEGEFAAATGSRYHGQWECNRKHGKGIQEYLNGDRYDGYWFNGMCSGHGVYFFKDGARYEGVWSHGRYDGPGVLVRADGSAERQWHRSGLLMKREVIVSEEAMRVQDGLNTAVNRHVEVMQGQTRTDALKSVKLEKLQPSKFALPRETAGMDLTAPPLLPKCSPAPLADARPQESLVPPPPVTACEPRSCVYAS
mmetsp:Transcript_50062/g.112737  ORF Transcript_50062/g.112737 Transcript_50062/m.112737 type:complete len:324 (+) Transcript_50062:66-1037(+)